MIAYKLVKIKDDKLYSLFINRKEQLQIGKWLKAECFTTKGFAKRVGWHCCLKPIAPHLKQNLANGEKRIWVECEIKDYTTYNRPESQGGVWLLAEYIKINRCLIETRNHR
jgi:hypothetical protein